MRAVALALALAAAPAAAQNANPPPYLIGDEPGLFPGWQDRWLSEVRSPAGAAKERFLRVEAKPNDRIGWDISVTCGLVSRRDGRETVLVQGRGDATRGRQPFLGGTWTPTDGSGTQSFMLGQGPRDIGKLDLRGETTDSRCAAGVGQLSSGD